MPQDDYIYTSSKRIKQVLNETYVFDQVFVHTKDPLSKRVDLSKVLNTIQRKLPTYIGQLVDSIMIGDFKELRREPPIVAFYENGALFVTNDPPNTEAMIKSIVHEYAHALEEAMGLEIYYDNSIEDEFVRKRLLLKNKLEDYEVPIPFGSREFMNCEYSQDFDEYLYDIGYEKLGKLMTGIFVNPYSATSLREYFASGFEEFILTDGKFLSETCPVLYQKLSSLVRQH